MFTTARDVAKLRPADFAKMLGVSRVTCSLWFNGHANPHRLLRAKVDRLLAAIAAAVQDAQLPVPPSIERQNRESYIKQAVASQLKKLAPAAA